ncbi:MAG: thiamine phosphate synthase [Magnetococcales bacterium]|nr:thiamine phosphate synthase [Magnetococcales bacterium]
MKPPIPKLLLITDLQVCPDLQHGVAQALTGGVKHVLLRIKNSKDKNSLGQWAKKLHILTQKQKAHLLISGDIDVALAFNNVGLHLPDRAITTQKARKLLGNNRLLGRSCHNLIGALSAIKEGADYITLSPLFATKSHPQAIPLGLEQFAAIKEKIPGPVLALGGINGENTPAAISAGAYGVALIRGILGEPSPKDAARILLQKIEHN